MRFLSREWLKHKVFSCLHSDTTTRTVSLFILSSVLHSFPTDSRLIYSLEIYAMTPTITCYCLLSCLSFQKGWWVSSLARGKSRVSSSTVFLGLKGPTLGQTSWAKRRGPCVSLSSVLSQNEATVDVDRCERKDVGRTDCFHMYNSNSGFHARHLQK